LLVASVRKSNDLPIPFNLPIFTANLQKNKNYITDKIKR